VLYPYSEHGLNPDELTIPDLLKSVGYRTGMVGKWHLGHQAEFMPLRQGFDYFFGVPYSNDMDGFFYRGLDFQSPPLPLYENEAVIEHGPDQASLTGQYTEAAIGFIRDNAEGPFFLYVAHSMPHLPLHASEAFAGTSALGLYGDVIQEIDWSVGQILDTLQEADLDRRTLILFASDNGPVLRPGAGSAGPLRGGKAMTWEGGMRVPGIVRWPARIPAGSETREIATTMDLLPTLVSLAGGEVPEGLTIDGFDISALLHEPEEARSPYDALYYYSRNGFPEAIREGPWKLHVAKSRGWNPADGEFPISLFNLETDVGENRNVAADYPGLVERLRGKLEQFDLKVTQEARPVGRLGSRSP
jgi:arylsulfatase A-like enzyme